MGGLWGAQRELQEWRALREKKLAKLVARDVAAAAKKREEDEFAKRRVAAEGHRRDEQPERSHRQPTSPSPSSLALTHQLETPTSTTTRLGSARRVSARGDAVARSSADALEQVRPFPCTTFRLCHCPHYEADTFFFIVSGERETVTATAGGRSGV